MDIWVVSGHLQKGKLGTVGGVTAGETVSECMPMNIVICCELGQLLMYSDVFVGIKRYLGHLPGHGSLLNAAHWGKFRCTAVRKFSASL